MWEKDIMMTPLDEAALHRATSEGRSPLANAGFFLRRFFAFCLFFVWIVAIHSGESTDRVSTIRVPGALKMSKAQRGADGTIHLVGDAESGPQYLKSQDGGITFSAPLAVVDR